MFCLRCVLERLRLFVGGPLRYLRSRLSNTSISVFNNNCVVTIFRLSFRIGMRRARLVANKAETCSDTQSLQRCSRCLPEARFPICLAVFGIKQIWQIGIAASLADHSCKRNGRFVLAHAGGNA